LADIFTPDLCVIGAGAAGVAVAEAARRVGATVTLVAGNATGDPPRRMSVALRALAAAAERSALAVTSPPFGIYPDTAPKVSFRAIHDHIAQALAPSATRDAAARLAALGIGVVPGPGAFVDPRTLRAGEATIRARRFVIATGGRDLPPDAPGLDSVPFFTTETIFDNTRKLNHLVVIGAGPMGLELALSYNRLGCAVTLIDRGKVLPHADPELAEIALRRLREEGVKLLEDTIVTAVQPGPNGVLVQIGGDGAAVDASHVLVAPGRVANLDGLDLDKARIRRGKSDPGALSLSQSLRTTNGRVFAVGEAAGHAPAPHLNALEADLVVRAALLGQPSRYDPMAVPRLTLTDPPIAEIGLTEQVARNRFKTGFGVLRASFAETDAARADRQGMGVVKLIVARTGRILGAGIVGRGAGELASLFALAITQNIDASRLADLPAPHPSYAELARRLGEQAFAGSPQALRLARRFRLARLLP
jgi:pyruvate/2-oxoglutarate dehydrogenase complex dihydrolipoamide dehydrogenase (E3) component